jgi:hypothetical protein
MRVRGGLDDLPLEVRGLIRLLILFSALGFAVALTTLIGEFTWGWEFRFAAKVVGPSLSVCGLSSIASSILILSKAPSSYLRLRIGGILAIPFGLACIVLSFDQLDDGFGTHIWMSLSWANLDFWTILVTCVLTILISGSLLVLLWVIGMVWRTGRDSTGNPEQSAQ